MWVAVSPGSDLRLARRLQEEEKQRRKEQEAKREAEEFKKLQVLIKHNHNKPGVVDLTLLHDAQYDASVLCHMAYVGSVWFICVSARQQDLQYTCVCLCMLSVVVTSPEPLLCVCVFRGSLVWMGGGATANRWRGPWRKPCLEVSWCLLTSTTRELR